LKDIKRAQEIGIEAYSDEQTEKANILHTLLSDYNDGRRKTFFCAAVNLIPLEQMRTIMEQAAANGPHTLKEKAEYVAALFRSYAEKNGLVLGLRRKPAML
jgi:3-deoxy-D-manno-octulosonate 8-phosphate phosphatase KdsC-like HAD superfamily phosphatase